MIQISRAEERRIINQGKFIIHMLPLGNALKNHNDHGIYQLGRLDHATLQAGVLVKMHLHHNDEILSYMRKGTMIHEDSQGTKVPVHSTHLMMMNAGSGLYHEESVPEEGETVEMLQIFMRPRADELPPSVQFHTLNEAYSLNEWRLIGGNEDAKAPLKINSEVLFYDTHLENATIATPESNGLSGFLYVFDGEVELLGKSDGLSKGDSVFFKDEQLSLKTSSKADMVVFVLNEAAKFSRNGLYSR